MTKEEIRNLLDIGENAEIEMKKSKGGLPESLWETYSAFANTNGGKIILGIEENPKNVFTIAGIKSTKTMLKNFWDNINNKKKININILLDKDVDVINVNGDSIIVISIPRANREEKPIYINGNPMTGTFKRNFEGDYRCSENEVRRMIDRKSTRLNSSH